MAVMVEWEDMVDMAVMVEWEVMAVWEDMVDMAVMAVWEAQLVGRIVTVAIILLMDSIPIMVNLMASIIRTTTLLRVIRNNLTIKNHILANLNKVNILTLTSLSMSLTEELSPSMTSTLSLSMTLLVGLPRLSMTSTLSPSKTLIVGLPRLSMTSTLSHSMTLTEVPSLNKINILIPAILSRHIVNQSS